MSSETENQAVLLVERPQGAVTPACFRVEHRPVPQPGAGDVLVRNIYLSCDPYMRGQFGESRYKSAFALGEPVPARVVGQVHASTNPSFAVGEFVWGFLAWEQYTLVEGGQGLRKIDPSLGPISHAISVLGMPGLTAWVGVDLCAAEPGQTAFVSAASGAVGQVAGQLFKLAGARVVGSAGTDAKVAYLIEALGFDDAFNYRAVAAVETALAVHCPAGVDAYFDNVGGPTLDAVLARLNDKARIAVCGQISQYDEDENPYRLANVRAILGTRSSMTGFSVRDNMHRFDTVIAQLAALMQQGKLRYREDIIDGIENTPAAFIGMMQGDNLGKRLVRVGTDPSR